VFSRTRWLFFVVFSLLPVSAMAQLLLDIDAYVEIVLRAHPRAAQTVATQRLAAAELRAAGAWPDPVIGLARGRGRGFPDSQVGNPEWNFSISQTVPWPGVRPARERAAELAGRVAMSGEESARWDLELQARAAFWRLQYARSARDLAQRNDEAAAGVLELTTRRVDVGEAREADRNRAHAERLRAALVVRNAELEARAAEEALRLLAVEPLGDSVQLAVAPPRAIAPTEIEARRQGLARSSPYLRTAIAGLEREKGLAALARAARGPDLDLSWLQTSEIDKRSWSFSVGVSLPVWNGGRREVARAEAAVSLARAAIERSRLEVSLAFEQAVQEAEAAEATSRLLETGIVPAARRTFELVRLSYEAGETSLLDLLDAQRTLRAAEIEELSAGLALVRARTEIDRISGRYDGVGEKR